MFKSLKKKLEQGVAQSKAAVSALTRSDDDINRAASSESLDKSVDDSSSQINVDQSIGHSAGRSVSVRNQNIDGTNIPVGHLVDISLSESSNSTSRLEGEESLKGSRSRTSSISSMASENSVPNVSFSQSFSIPSDVESEVEDTSINLSTISREDLYAFVKRFEQRAFKYKSKFMELATAYKDVLVEKERLKTKLLKEGKVIPAELESDFVSKQTKAEAAVFPQYGNPSVNISATNDEVEVLKSKIKRQDGLLQKCKETITNYKERLSQLTQDKQELLAKLELSSKNGDKSSAQTPEQISRLQTQVKEARKVIEQLETDREVSIAAVKQQIHEEMEKKDAELEQVKIQFQKNLAESNTLKLEIEKLTDENENLHKTNQEQLEKARDIMRKLKEDKRLALEQAETRIRQAEQSMEDEKEKMLIELKRGKAEAFSVMQQESEKNLAEKVEAAVQERDSLWKKKMTAQEMAHNDMLQSKDREKELALATMQEEVRRKLKEKEEEVRLALEERELQKMAAVTGLDEQKDKLLQQIEELNSEKIQLSNRFSKYQEDSDHQLTELKEKLHQKDDEHVRTVEMLRLNHMEALEHERNKLLQKFHEDIELLKQIHAVETQAIMDKQEQILQESNAEMESYYKNQMETERQKLENLLAVTKDQLEEMRNHYLNSQAKLADREEQDLALTGLTSEKEKHETVKVQGETAHFSSKEDLTQRSPTLQEEESSTENQDQTLNEPELSVLCQSLSQELSSVREQLAATENELKALKEVKCDIGVEHQQKLSQPDGESEVEDHTELREQIIELRRENECLVRNAENSKIRMEELEKYLGEQKKAAESKTQELESQVWQLQNIIRTLESCQSIVEREKAGLEEKLTSLENIVENLKASKEELNEKLHERHESFVQKSAIEKQTLELRLNEQVSEMDILREQVESLNRALLSKNDENLALRSVVDDGNDFSRSQKATIEKLTAELQTKNQTCSQNETALAISLEKFEKLKAEANTKIKALKEMKDSLTEQLNQKEKECEEIVSFSTVEKENLIKNFEEKLSKQDEEFSVWKQTLREQFDKKQERFKETVARLKEQHEIKLQEKEKQFEDQIKELTSQKDVSVVDLTKKLEMLKEQQLKSQEQKYQEALDKATAEWENRIQKLNDDHGQKLENVSSQYQQTVDDLQQKLSDKENVIQELISTRDKLANIQMEYDSIKIQLDDLSDKHRAEIENLSTQQTEKEARNQELSVRLESLQKQAALDTEQRDRFTNEIQTLKDLLQDKDLKLELMASTVSAEQQYLHKQLDEQITITERLQADKDALVKQLEETTQKHIFQLQEKDALMHEISQKFGALQLEHSSLKEDLKTVTDDSAEKDAFTRNLQEEIEILRSERDAQVHSIKSAQEITDNNITSLQEEMKHINELHAEALASLQQNHKEEIDIVISYIDSQVSGMVETDSELRTRLTKIHGELQECFQKYESRLEEEKSKKERQEADLKEQINILKQQLQTEVSSNEIQSNLIQSVKEGEEKQKVQQEEIRQEMEQKMKEMKLKYIAKIKEVQNQAKGTIEELEIALQNEKLSKSEMYTELTRANTRLLQLEENSGTSKYTIVDLENKIVEMTAVLESKDGELKKLKADMLESEKNMQEILEETQANCKQINDKLENSESELKDKESNIQSINEMLKEKLNLLEQKESYVRDLEKRCSTLEEINKEEKHKYEFELAGKDNKCSELEGLLEKMQNMLNQVQRHSVELENKVHSADTFSVELERIQVEKQQLQSKLSQSAAERDELKSKVTEIETEFEKFQSEQTLVSRELETKITEAETEKVTIQQDYKRKLNQLHQTHQEELKRLSMDMEAQSSSKVAEYKKKAEAYITEVKKRLQDENAASLDKQQENIKRLEDSLNSLTQELIEHKQSQEKLVAENEETVQTLKSLLEQERKLQQSVTEDSSKKEEEFHQTESRMMNQIDLLLSEKNLLLEKLSFIEKDSDKWKQLHGAEIEELKSRNEELKHEFEFLKSVSDEELKTLKSEMEKIQNNYKTVLEEQAAEHSSEIQRLVTKMNQQATRQNESDVVLNKTVDNTDNDLEEQLRREILEKDKCIQELHLDYKAKIQVLQDEQSQRLGELQSELSISKQRIITPERRPELENQIYTYSAENQQNALATAQERDIGKVANQSQGDITEFWGDDSQISFLQEQVTHLTREIELMKERHKQELAEVHSRIQAGHNSLTQSVSGQLNLDILDPNFSEEMQNLELQNMDLKAQLSQLNGELSLGRIRERDLLRKMEKLETGGKSMSDDDDPPLSMDGSYLNHDDSAVFREPTEFEYLKNILYEYMMGRETKTLTKVVGTVMRFSDEQMKSVIARADTRLAWKS